MIDAEKPGPKPPSRTWLPDFLASTVVFLVALPLCIGIAVACGVPAERGLVTGIIGGTVVGIFSGAPLLVSGPAASLIVPVVDLIQTHGLPALAPVVVLAGVWQALAGVLRLGKWFRAVAPAVIVGMLVGIGLLILASQLHVGIDAEPRASFVDNLIYFPQALLERPGGKGRLAPLLISSATIGLIVAWDRLKPKALVLMPGQLVSLVLVTAATVLSGADVIFLDISPDFFAGLAPPRPSDFKMVLKPDVVGLSLMFAFVASAATLLTANAIDQRQTRSKTKYDKEMLAQGIGNMLTGAVGGLPMTGVIVRSSVNVDAGAQTRRSTILHGVWILLFVSAAPEILELIPRASLGAILVYTGYRLIDRRSLVSLYRQGRAELAICLITLFGVVFIDLFVGILAGLAAAISKIVYTFAKLEIRSEADPSRMVHDLHLTGSATFLQLPRLASELDAVPDDRELHVHIDQLDHIDHACLQLLSSWNTGRETAGKPGMIVEWDELTQRYRNALVGGARGRAPRNSIMSTIWEEWKHLYAPRPNSEVVPEDAQAFIDADRVRVQVEAGSLVDVVAAAAEALAPVAGRPEGVLREALAGRIEGHVVLGGGISVPHAPIEGLDESIVSLVTTKGPVAVGDGEADLFFVLLAPHDDPRKHLQSLAHVGRLCHDQSLLDDLRDATDSEEAARVLRAVDRAVFDTGTVSRARRLAVIEVEEQGRVSQVVHMANEAFGRSTSGSGRTEPVATIRRALGASPTSHYVLVNLVERDLPVLQALLEEEGRLVGRVPCRFHMLRSDAPPAASGAPRTP